MKIGIQGAGSVGCWVGGRLTASGQDVVLLGRERVQREVEGSGLSLFDVEGRETRVEAERVAFATDPEALGDRDVVLCSVKSAHTEAAARELATVLGPDALVVSLQNGVGNSDVLRTHLPGHPVLAGIVSFNVVGGRPGVFRQGTSGPLIIERSSSPIALQLCDALRRSGIGVVTPREIARHQWAKLLMNLGNAVSALSGAPTREMILTPGYRKILASIIGEALRVLSAAGIRPAKLRGVPPALLVTLLGLPTPLVRVFARAQLRVNADARSSMWEDLERKRATEVDYLNGEIVRVAARAGVEARVNGAIVALVHEVEARGQGSPNLSPEALSAALTAAGAPS